MKKLSIALAAGCLVTSLATAEEPHWGYSGAEGPQKWGSLSTSYATCSSGHSQSPIDIEKSKDAKLEPIQFNYRPGGNAILNKGHTVQVSYDPGSRISVDGQTYELQQFHFHAPSENRIHGKSFPMEAHFVHASTKGQLAVIAVMLEEGAANAILDEAWAKIPAEVGAKAQLSSLVSADKLLPASREYYQFTGSLTTPPCTEGVLWLVMKNPLTVSSKQIGRFEQVVHHPNNRPVQALNNRVVLE